MTPISEIGIVDTSTGSTPSSTLDAPPTGRGGWWRSDHGYLFGWVHEPSDGIARAGVLLCPPLLDEPYWTHSTYRALGRRLAEAGFVVLYLDYRGTGDSPMRAEDVADLGQWRDDITAAAAELRRWGVSAVAAVGMRAAANLLSSVGPGVLDARVFWDPVADGRTYLRQVVTLSKMTMGAAVGDRTGTVPDAGHEVGYQYPRSLVESLRALPPCSTVAEPTLLLTRDGHVPRRVRLGAATEIRPTHEQQALLDTFLNTVVIPERTLATIVDWLSARLPSTPRPISVRLCSEWRGDGLLERVAWIGAHGALFAIITEPERGAAALTCLMLNSGAQYHIGPQRAHVEIARNLAPVGIRSIRMDFRGLGDTGGSTTGELAPLYSPQCIEDLDGVLEQFQDGPLAALGLCSGGYHALEAAARFPLVGAIGVHLNPSMGQLGSRLVADGAERPVARALADRPWMAILRRTWLGRALIWRTPGIAWWLLDRTHLQPGLVSALRVAGRRNADVVIFLEEATAKRPEGKGLTLLRRSSRATVSVTTADHGLWDSAARQYVIEACQRLILGWARDRRAAGPQVTARGRTR